MPAPIFEAIEDYDLEQVQIELEKPGVLKEVNDYKETVLGAAEALVEDVNNSLEACDPTSLKATEARNDLETANDILSMINIASTMPSASPDEIREALKAFILAKLPTKQKSAAQADDETKAASSDGNAEELESEEVLWARIEQGMAETQQLAEKMETLGKEIGKNEVKYLKEKIDNKVTFFNAYTDLQIERIDEAAASTPPKK